MSAARAYRDETAAINAQADRIRNEQEDMSAKLAALPLYGSHTSYSGSGAPLILARLEALGFTLGPRDEKSREDGKRPVFNSAGRLVCRMDGHEAEAFVQALEEERRGK